MDTVGLKGRKDDGERYRQMAKMLIGNSEDKKLSNEISAPYEVPQYPIEQIETKLIRYDYIYGYTCNLKVMLGYNCNLVVIDM